MILTVFTPPRVGGWGGGVLLITSFTGRLYAKGVPVSGFRYIEG